jgi:hypothetical protein
MSLLAAKLILTPLIILIASLVSRRWGDAVGGWLVGLPVVSGPVSVFLAIERGPEFTAQAALGSVAGVFSQASFCVGYGLAASLGWPTALASASVAYVVTAALSTWMAPPLIVAAPVAAVALLAARRFVPRSRGPHFAVSAPWWEIPGRMVVVTGLVIAITGLASTLGPRASGVSSSFPVVSAALAIFAHVARGPAGGLDALRGMASALYGFIGFFVVIATAMVPFGAPLAFALAVAVALVIQGFTLLWIQREGREHAAGIAPGRL